jgi:hypothetical protein
MKNSFKALAGIIVSCFVLWGCPKPKPVVTVDKIVLPSDALDSCTLTSTAFNNWFVSGSATANGVVKPANSLTFPHNNNCDFYQWSANMFLWITSPHEGIGKTVLESPVFYDVLPADDDTSGQRKLVPHTASMGLRMSSHIIKNGPDRLPVVFDKDGRMLEIENGGRQANLKALVKGGTSNAPSVEVDHVTKDVKGAFVFMDKQGKVIDQPKAIIRHKLHKENFVERFAVVNSNQSVLLDMNGKQVQTEAGQATGDVLMTQGGSLVYYVTMVNNVYAYFATGAINGALKHDQFPTDTASLAAVVAYAKANHQALPDSNALAIELKTAWVEASKVPNAADYVTAMATIPKYDTTNNKKWVPKGDTLVKMALVGMHIVGSAAGHPEMIWATFEHQSNTPNAAYDYLDKTRKLKTVAQDTGSHWLFSSNGLDPKPNVSHMNNFLQASTGDTINAQPGYTISPSNTLAALPWGSQRGAVTNQQDSSSAASNSEIISLNYALQQLIPAGDVRKNYLLVGATWTAGGAPPTGLIYGSGGIQHHSTQPGASIGTSVLANTTMETYFQLPKYSCFTCHSTPATPSVNPDSISHIFGSLQPLITLHEVLDKKKKK